MLCRSIDPFRQQSDALKQRRADVTLEGAGIRLAIAVLGQGQLAYDPFRAFRKPLAHADVTPLPRGNSRVSGNMAAGYFYRPLCPGVTVAGFALLQFLKKDDIGGDFRIGDLLKCLKRKTNGSEQASTVRQILPGGRIGFVQRPGTRDECNETSRPDHFKRTRKKVVVDQKVPKRNMAGLRCLVIAERNVRDHQIEEVGR